MFKRLIIIAVSFFSIFLLNAERYTLYAEASSYIDAFDQADTNRDGYVSEDEASKSGLLNSDNFMDADSDADGFLSLREAKGANLQLPKTEEEKPVARIEQRQPQVAQTAQQVDEPAQVPPEIQKEQDKLGITAQQPITKPKPRVSASPANRPTPAGTTRPTRSVQGQRRPRSAVGAPGNAMPLQGSVRGPRRPPSFAGKRVPKPPSSTTPSTPQPQPPQ